MPLCSAATFFSTPRSKPASPGRVARGMKLLYIGAAFLLALLALALLA
jgi:hypothetical protein